LQLVFYKLLQLNKDYDRRNFVDYVKYLFHPVKEEKDLRTTQRNLLKRRSDGGDGGRGGHVVGKRTLDFISPKICTSYQSG
jgi:hypothetical protein